MNTETKFGSWSVTESPIRIEYSLIVVEEVRQVVADGYQRLSRGGIEVGGVLYGNHDGDTVRILAMREIPCEHARGPSFLLSDNDRSALAAQLVSDRTDHRLDGMEPVGWFLSHTRSDIMLTDSDVESYNTYFPLPWQVTLVIRPGRGGSMQAGFFIREEDGTVRAERTYLTFNFPDRMGGGFDRRDPGQASERRPTPQFESSAPAPRDVPSFGRPAAPPPPLPSSLEEPPTQAYQPYWEGRRKRWPWAVLAAVLALAAGLAIFGLRYFGTQVSTDPLALAVAEHEGQLQIQWNHASRSILRATRGTLDITDGTDTRTVELNSDDLAKGNFTYERKTGDVTVHFQVQNSGGEKMQEVSRFVGTAPRAVADPNEVDTLKVEHDALQDELTRLRGQNAQQAQRIQQLERTLTIMQTRLGVDSGKR